MNEHAGRGPAKRVPPPPVRQAPAGPGVARPDQPLIVVAQWTGALAAALWIATRETIYDYAARVGAGVSTVDDWDHYPEIIPSLKKAKALDALLRKADRETLIRFAQLTRSDPQVWVSDSLGLDGNGDNADRREITKAAAVGLASAALGPLAAVERIAVHLGRPERRVDARLLADHEEQADWLAVRHLRSRPDELVGQVAHHADTLLVLRERPMTQTERTRLEAVAVGSCAQAGLLAFFAGDRAVAGRYFALARTTAKDSGDATLHGQALVAASVLYSPVPTGGRGGDSRRSVDLLTEAVERLRPAPGQVRAWAYRWLGMELAAAGKERGFHQVMELAGRMARQAGPHDPRGFFARYVADLNRNSAVRDEGVGYLLLGLADQAVAALSPVRMVGSLQRWASRLTDLAAARVLQGEPEEACALLGEALDLTLNDGRWMGVERILGARARFPKGKWDDLACVRELDERLRALTGL